MNVFGYLYYKFSKPYKKVEREDEYYDSPIILLSMCQTINILSLLQFIIKFSINYWIVIIIQLFVILINYTYFLSRSKRKQYEGRWNKEKGAKKMWGTVLANAYIVFSFVIFAVSLVYDFNFTRWDWDMNWSWRWTL